MKRRYVLIFTIFIISLSACIFYISNANPKKGINPNNVNHIKITALPSPPKIKYIDKEEDIERIAKFLNSIDYVKIKEQAIGGWQYKIDIGGIRSYSISFIGDKIEYNKKWYKVDEDTIDEMKKLYESLEYKESSYK